MSRHKGGTEASSQIDGIARMIAGDQPRNICPTLKKPDFITRRDCTWRKASYQPAPPKIGRASACPNLWRARDSGEGRAEAHPSELRQRAGGAGSPRGSRRI